MQHRPPLPFRQISGSFRKLWSFYDPLSDLARTWGKRAYRGATRGSGLVGFLAVASIACSPDAGPIISFCEVTDSLTACRGDQAEFSVGQELKVYLESERPLEAQQVVGKILRITEKDTISLGSRVFSLEPEQRSIVQNLPFHEFGPQAAGRFLIEFVDENDQVIAQKELTIR